MAANKFATMVNKSTHKLVLLLVYALLEWLLISLLLLNSLFGYLISKFASYFGLQKPCLWCSRIDHILENSPRNKNSYTELLCEAHAAEISRLRFCSSHKRLAESSHMCWDCSVSDRNRDHDKGESFYSRCRCCDERFGREDLLIDPYSILSPSWGISEIARIGDLGEDKRVSDKMLSLVTSVDNGYVEEEEEEEDCLSSSSMFICYEREAMECSKTGSLDGSVRQIFQSDASIVQCRSKEDDSVEDISCGYSQSVCDHRLVPVELIDLSTITESKIGPKPNESTVEDLEMVMSCSGDQSLVTESEEINKHDLVRKESEQVLTTEEVHTLQINVKKAVMTKLNDLPGPECESADKDFSSSNDIGPDHRDKDKLPDTPTSTMSEKMEPSENGDSASTVEQLRAALRSERKALIALYAELEEERSASAVAASETLAMITRLQEEKAAVQMEAVQYQRMMEEQSEYDQEALQLLNDLMVKREREKQELERELERFRKKAVEERERMPPSSPSSWYGDETGDETVANLEEMAVECERSVGILGESLTEFEEERLSILGQLKALEERLEKLGDEEEEEKEEDCNGLGSMAKKLLPFLDEAESGSEGSAKIAIEEEVDRVYERLQALEADREFLKNCVGSIKKGDKGMDLLHEILQHLRDLRTVELRMSVANEEDLGEEVSVI